MLPFADAAAARCRGRARKEEAIQPSTGFAVAGGRGASCLILNRSPSARGHPVNEEWIYPALTRSARGPLANRAAIRSFCRTRVSRATGH